MSTHDTDFYQWTQEQARLLRQGQLSAIDVDHLIEEIESMGNANKSAIKSHLLNLVMHLLKLHYQPDYPGKSSWIRSVGNARDSLQFIVEDNPSLATFAPDSLLAIYPKAKRKASRETGLPATVFPDTCQWDIDQILDDDFFPNAQ